MELISRIAGQRIASTVFTIPYQRMTCPHRMFPYLVFFAGDEPEKHKRCINPCTVVKRITLCHSFAVFILGNNKLCIHSAAYNTQIIFIYRFFSQALRKPLCARKCSRKTEYAGGILIKPVQRPGFKR